MKLIVDIRAMKTIAIITGTLLAVCVLTVAAFATYMYIEAEEEEFSRAAVINHSSTELGYA